MSKTKKTIVIIIGIVLLIGVGLGMWFVYQANKDTPTEGIKSITIKIISERDSYNFERKYNTDKEYLGDFLEKEGLVDFDSSTYGRFITAAQGYKANDDEQSWWCVLVNDESSLTGIDEIAISDGSVYTLQLMIGW